MPTEGTMTVAMLQNGKPTEIPQSLRASLGGETSEPGEWLNPGVMYAQRCSASAN